MAAQGRPPPFAAAPADAGLQQRIDTLVAYCVKNGGCCCCPAALPVAPAAARLAAARPSPTFAPLPSLQAPPSPR